MSLSTPCGFSQDKLLHLLKEARSTTPAMFGDYFLTNMQFDGQSVDMKFLPRSDLLPHHPRCIECGKTIPEHPAERARLSLWEKKDVCDVQRRVPRLLDAFASHFSATGREQMRHIAVVGESGAGKSVAATLDLKHALTPQATTGQPLPPTFDVIRIVLYEKVIVAYDNIAERDRLSCDVLKRMIGIESKVQRPTYVVLDECQNDVQFCRGAIRSAHALGDVTIVACGLSFSNDTYNASEVQPDLQSRTIVLSKTFPHPLGTIDDQMTFACHFHRFLRGACHWDSNPAESLAVISDPSTRLVLHRCGWNLAAHAAYAKLDSTRFRSVDAVTEALIHALRERNGLLRVPGDDLFRICNAALDSAYARLSNNEYVCSLHRGLVTAVTDDDTARTIVTMTGLYWLFCRGVVASAKYQCVMSWNEFEVLIANQVSKRVSCLVEGSSFTAQDIFPGVEDCPAVKFTAGRVPVVKVIDAFTSEAHLKTARNEALQIIDFKFPGTWINKAMARYGDFITMLNGLLLVVQLKLFESAHGHKPGDIKLPYSAIMDEYNKAGFGDPTDRYAAQHGLTLALKERCGGHALFVLVTNKIVDDVPKKGKPSDMVIIHQGNIEMACAPSIYEADYLLPAEAYSAVPPLSPEGRAPKKARTK